MEERPLPLGYTCLNVHLGDNELGRDIRSAGPVRRDRELAAERRGDPRLLGHTIPEQNDAFELGSVEWWELGCVSSAKNFIVITEIY